MSAVRGGQKPSVVSIAGWRGGGCWVLGAGFWRRKLYAGFVPGEFGEGREFSSDCDQKPANLQNHPVSRQAGGPVRGTGRFWERTWVSRCCTIPVDLSAIDGMDEVTAHIVLTEVGPDFSAFGSASEFCSWLRLCPNNKVSGGRILARQTRKGKPRLALALRTAAQNATRQPEPDGRVFPPHESQIWGSQSHHRRHA